MKIKTPYDVRPGQIREFTSKKGGLVFVYETEGFRADVIYDSGRKDSVFAGWLCDVTRIISEVGV